MYWYTQQTCALRGIGDAPSQATSKSSGSCDLADVLAKAMVEAFVAAAKAAAITTVYERTIRGGFQCIGGFCFPFR
jgi:hypothetical protein